MGIGFTINDNTITVDDLDGFVDMWADYTNDIARQNRRLYDDWKMYDAGVQCEREQIYLDKLQAYRRTPWWRQLFVDEPVNPPSWSYEVIPPRALEPSIEDFLSWLARRRPKATRR